VARDPVPARKPGRLALPLQGDSGEAAARRAPAVAGMIDATARDAYPSRMGVRASIVRILMLASLAGPPAAGGATTWAIQNVDVGSNSGTGPPPSGSCRASR